jgi:hypothetical protein
MVSTGVVDNALEHSAASLELSAVRQMKAQAANLQRAMENHDAHAALGARLVMPSGGDPLDWWYCPDSWHAVYANLLSWGVGGPELFGDDEDARADSKYVSLKCWAKHVLLLDDDRFRKSWDFPFTAYNILRVRETVLNARLHITVPSNYAAAVNVIDECTVDDLWKDYKAQALKQQGRPAPALNPKTQAVLKHVNAIAGRSDDSEQSKLLHRRRLRGLQISDGPPSFFLTINPDDTNHPLVLHLAGFKFDLTDAATVPDRKRRIRAACEDPVASTLFYHTMIEKVISQLLAYNKSQHGYISKNIGLLGRVKNYYGMSECTQRGYVALLCCCPTRIV